MSDRDRIAEVLRPEYTYDPNLTPDAWSYWLADVLIAAGVTLPAPPALKFCQIRGNGIGACVRSAGHNGKCW